MEKEPPPFFCMNEKDIVRQIDAASVEDREFRPYLGASLIGNNCEAFLQMQLKGYPSKDFAPHTLRIFALGHVLEDMVVADLKKAGFKVMEKDDLTGRQFEWKECGGHVKAHADGLIDIDAGSLSLLEIKSMNDKKWGEFKKEGVRISHPNYFAQCQMMMGMGKIKNALLVAYNKNTSHYHVEIIPFDDLAFSHIAMKINRVLAGGRERTSDSPDRMVCKFCNRRPVCWTEEMDALIAKECRTCNWSKANDDGSWQCMKHEKRCREICDDWVRINLEEEEPWI